MFQDDDVPWDQIFDKVLGFSEEVPPGIPLPDTGVEEWREQKMSAMRILPFWNFGLPVHNHSLQSFHSAVQGGLYGTRSQIVIAVWSDHSVEIQERIWDAEQRCCHQAYSFHLD